MTATSAKNKLTVTASADEPVIVLTREFEAPRELVFELHTKPHHVMRWWGPRYITVTKCEIDFRPGGEWRYEFTKEGMAPLTFKGVYKEIVVAEKIVNTFIYDVPVIRDHPALETATFEDLGGGRSRLTRVARHDTFEARDGHLHSGMEAGAAETLDRLEEVLTTMPRELTLTRMFNAPRELVFAAWTERDRLARWWGPKGFTNPVCNVDVRPGGAIEIHMRGPDGSVYPMGGEFVEIAPPSRVVFRAWAVNARGQRMFETLTAVELIERGAKTEMHFNTRAVKVTGEAAGPLSGMTQGWTESLERLKAEVEK